MIKVPESNANIEWKVYKYPTGETIPEDSIYLYSTTNGTMHGDYKAVWHYFLTPVKKVDK